MIIQEHNEPGKNPHSGQSFFDDPEKQVGEVSAPAVAQQRTPTDILKEIYSLQAPQPTYDPQRPEEIKRIGRVNAIGEGLKTIGDIVSLGVGANVTKRAPDQVTPNMLSALWQNRDKAAAQKDNWNYQNYLTKLRNAQTELGQVNHDNSVALQQQNRKEDITRQDTWRTEDNTHRDTREGIADNRYDTNYKDDQQWRNVGEFENWKKKTDHQFGLDMQKLDKRLSGEMAKYAAKASFNGKNFNLFDDSGQVVKTLSPGELEKITQLILKDPAVAASATHDIGLMKAQFGEGLSKQAEQTIIAYYWNKSPEVIKYLKGSQQSAAPASNLSPQGQAEQNQAVQNTANKLPGLGTTNTTFKLPGLGK